MVNSKTSSRCGETPRYILGARPRHLAATKKLQEVALQPTEYARTVVPYQIALTGLLRRCHSAGINKEVKIHSRSLHDGDRQIKPSWRPPCPLSCHDSPACWG